MPRDGHVSVFFGLGPRGDITEAMLRERIEEICPVTDFRMRERFAFVDCTHADADSIVRKLNGMKFNSSTLTCQISKRDDPARRRNDRNDRNDRRRGNDREGRRDRDRDDSRDRVRRRRDDSRDRRRRDDSRDRRRRDDSRDRRRDDSRDRRRRDDSRDRRRDDSRDGRRRDHDDPSRDKRRRREESRDRPAATNTEAVVETFETVGGGYTYGQSYANDSHGNAPVQNDQNAIDITSSYQVQQQANENGGSPRSVESPRSAASGRSASSPRRNE